MNIFKQRIIKYSLEKANIALKNQDRVSAAASAKHVLRFEANNLDALLILAATCQPEESISLLQKVLVIDPENIKAQEGLEWAMNRKGDFSREKIKSQTNIISKRNNTEKTNGFQFSNHIQAVVKNAGEKVHSPFFYRIYSRWQSWFALFFILSIMLIALFAPKIAPFTEDHNGGDYYKIICERLSCFPEEPSEEYILGTIKEFDVFHTFIWGTRQALLFGLGAAISTAIIGTILGAFSAYVGGWIDRIIMRICDAFLAFPIIAAVALFAQIIALLSPTSRGLTMEQFDAIPEQMNFLQMAIMNTDPILLALVLFSWMPYTRVIHAQVLHIKKSEYVDAAKSVGARNFRILFKHILPNSLAPAIVTATRDIGRMVVAQASFTFIGVGSSSAWATLLNIGKNWIIGPGGNLMARWWIYLPITLAMVFFGFSWSFLGDEINLWLNPRNL